MHTKASSERAGEVQMWVNQSTNLCTDATQSLIAPSPLKSSRRPKLCDHQATTNDDRGRLEGKPQHFRSF